MNLNIKSTTILYQNLYQLQLSRRHRLRNRQNDNAFNQLPRNKRRAAVPDDEKLGEVKVRFPFDDT